MPIVTDGLVGYWNSKQGVVGAVWENIAPATVGTFNGTITGALVQTDGMYFDGVDDGIQIATSLNLAATIDFTIEAWVKPHVSPNSENAIVSVDGLGSMFGYSPNTYKFYSGGWRTTSNTFSPNTLRHVVLRNINNSDLVEIYVDGVLAGSAITTTNSPFARANWAIGRRPGNSLYFFKGHIAVVRFYNRLLTPTEITQNYAVSTSVGLSVAPPPTTPVVTQLNASKTKISDEPNVNQSIITVQFDTDVTQYVARLNGSDYNTGTLVHTGGAVAANTDAQVVIDWNELTTEGSNRINVYGQNASGWTVLT